MNPRRLFSFYIARLQISLELSSSLFEIEPFFISMGAGASTKRSQRPEMPLRELSRRMLGEIEQYSARAQRRRRQRRRRRRQRRREDREQRQEDSGDDLLAIGRRCLASESESVSESESESESEPLDPVGSPEDFIEMANSERLRKKYAKEVVLDYLHGAMQFLFGDQ